MVKSTTPFERALIQRFGRFISHDQATPSDLTRFQFKPLAVDRIKVPRLKKPTTPREMPLEESRMFCCNETLMLHLRTHPDGNYVDNPHRKRSGEKTLVRTKETTRAHIKTVIRKWVEGTTEGRAFLAQAGLNVGEFTVDRIFPRQGDGFGGLNCVYNLYCMSFLDNARFGNVYSAQKRKFVGELAHSVANRAHKFFRNTLEDKMNFSNFRSDEAH